MVSLKNVISRHCNVSFLGNTLFLGSIALWSLDWIPGIIAFLVGILGLLAGGSDMELLFWQAFGTKMSVNYDKHIRYDQSIALTIKDEVRLWCKESIKRPYSEINSDVYYFLYRKDAMLFKLRWG